MHTQPITEIDTVLYPRDFISRPNIREYMLNNIQADNKAYFYDIEPETVKNLLELNRLYASFFETQGDKKLARFLLDMDKKKMELTAFCFKHFAHVDRLVTTGQEIGMQVTLKPEFRPAYAVQKKKP